MNRFAVIRKIDSLDSRSDVYTSEPIPCGAVSDPSSRDSPQSPMEDTQGSLTAAVQGTRSYYARNLQTQTLLVGPMPVIVRMKNYFSKFITSFIMTLKEMILMKMRIVLMLMMISLSMI